MAIMVTRSSMPDWEEYIEEIRPIFDNHQLTNSGPIYKKLENQLKKYLEVPILSLFVNGHMALEMALQAFGFRNTGGEVITTPFTFVSTVHAITRNGLQPVFCDIREDDYTLDPEKIESCITDKTIAILPVHVYGNICGVHAIEKIAEKHNIKVIYDAAHALGVTYNGVGIGNFGDASMFSFHATKVFNTIEGGAVSFHDHSLYERMEELKNFGIHGEDVLEIGANAKMDEFRAAMGICNLKHLNEAISARKKATEHYRQLLDGIRGIKLCPVQDGVQSNYSYFPIQIDASVFGINRDQIIKKLEDNEIFARKYFYPPVNEMSCYRDCRGETPIAHDVSKSILTLPLYEEIKEKEIDDICRIILSR